ncbi:MAG: glycosyl transferase family protein [Rhodospirillaceae bacterium]|nr:glycosyl transferase family protein [Rhodospirillaceae bacterium]
MLLSIDPYLLADYVRWLEWAAVLVSLIILLSSLDDAFIDAYYWLREAYRAVYVRRKYKPLSVDHLLSREEMPIAIMVPAWREDAVIGQMIENNVAGLEYSKFKIFCGTYKNDEATASIVDAMARRYKHVVHVRVPHDGPTCKADCLNWIIQAIFLHEEQHNMQFAGITVHDSEDVIHPLELKLFNFLLPKKDFIQLPVLSLERPWWNLVGSTYLDDFAEWHSKDLVVRESFLGEVPSAGVGTCFSRRAIKALSDQKNNEPFNTESLTEDYDFSFRLAQLGMDQVFVRVPVSYTTRRRSLLTGKERDVEVQSVIAIREFFPDDFKAAYRQRARWIFGIAFQGWLELGWRGNWRTLYMLIRDRKGAVTSLIAIFAYFLMFNFLLVSLLNSLLDINLYSNLIASHDWMQQIMVMNVALLLNRVGQRFYFVSSMYGIVHGIASIPRMIVNNAINFCAAMRAWKLLFVHVTKGKAVAWDKTDHVYPTTGHLKETHKRLGDLMVSWKAISSAQLAQALAQQTRRNQQLGKVILKEGWVSEEMLAELLAYQHDMPREAFDAQRVIASSYLLPLELIVRHRLLPFGKNADGTLNLLASAAPTAEALQAIEAATAAHPIVAIICESELVTGLRLIAGGDVVATRKPLLGDLLIEMGVARRQDLDEALRRYSPERHGRFGDFLVAQDVVQRADLDMALERQASFAAQPA